MARSIVVSPGAFSGEHTIALPGSKSFSNRALVLAAQAQDPTHLEGVSLSDDTLALVRGLEQFGVRCELVASGMIVSPPPTLTPYHGEIDVGPAGTTMRFLTAFCATVPGCDVTLTGSERMHQRPIAALVDPLRSLGATIDYLGTSGCPPLRVRGFSSVPAGSRISVDGSVSSQFISALMLMASRMNSPIVEVTGHLTSASYIGMTEQSLETAGVQFRRSSSSSWEFQSGSLPRGGNTVVEGDASGGSYLWGLAAMTRDTAVTISNISPTSRQGDVQFVDLLRRMGCAVVKEKSGITVRSPEGPLRAIECDMSEMPDVAQTVAVIATCAHGRTVMTGLQTLRIKETDRIAALQTELGKLDIVTECTADSLTIVGGNPVSAIIDTYDDHRMAMSFALLGTRPGGITLREPQVVSKSFPSFWDLLAKLGLTIANHSLVPPAAVPPQAALRGTVTNLQNPLEPALASGEFGFDDDNLA
jgi:3-phosphoshikimate 1-carboxyvinyltransferase